MATQVPLAIGPPNTLIFPISDAPGVFDLTTVTAVSFSVRAPDQTTTTWTATIPATVPATTGQYASLAGTANPTPTLLFAQHVFATSDVTQLGNYQVSPQLTVAGGTVPCYARVLVATDIFGM